MYRNYKVQAHSQNIVASNKEQCLRALSGTIRVLEARIVEDRARGREGRRRLERCGRDAKNTERGGKTERKREREKRGRGRREKEKEEEWGVIRMPEMQQNVRGNHEKQKKMEKRTNSDHTLRGTERCPTKNKRSKQHDYHRVISQPIGDNRLPIEIHLKVLLTTRDDCTAFVALIYVLIWMYACVYVWVCIILYILMRMSECLCHIRFYSTLHVFVACSRPRFISLEYTKRPRLCLYICMCEKNTLFFGRSFVL